MDRQFSMLEKFLMMRSNRKGNSEGFTLIELMTVVFVIGLLASVAIPTLTKYLRKSRTVEAIEAMGKISEGARVYYASHEMLFCDNATDDPCEAEQGWSPAMPLSDACTQNGGLYYNYAVDFQTAIWRGLLFQPTGAVRYQYSVHTHTAGHTGGTKSAVATAYAQTDMDCDGIYSVWKSEHRTNNENVLVRQLAPVEIANPLE